MAIEPFLTSPDLEPLNKSNLTFKFDVFEVHTSNNTLIKNGEEITVEPKVFQVLLYLCAHPNRYVNIQELHDNVWKGRVVSDAAVRRSISKLRALLDKAEIQYIKSTHGKGYKLSTEVQASVKTGCSPKAVLETSKTSYLTWPLLCVGGVLIVLVLLGLQYSGYFSMSYSEQKVVTFPGKKTHAVINNDNNRIAFSGKFSGLQGFQLFVTDLVTNRTRQLTKNDNNVVRVRFSNDNKSIYFIDMMLGNSKINCIGLRDSDTTSPQIFIEGFYLISDFVLLPTNEGMFFSANKDKFSPGQIYYYDFSADTTTLFMPSYQEDSHDYRLAISPDGKSLVVGTVLGDVIKQKITVYNIENRSIVKRFFHDQSFLSIIWDGDNNIIFLDKYHLYKFQVSSGKITKILPNKDAELVSLELDINADFIVLKQASSESVLMEVDLPGFEVTSQKMVLNNREKVDDAMFHGKSQFKLFTELSSNANSLFIKSDKSSFKDVLLKTTLSINMYDATDNGKLVLLKLDGLLALLDTETNEIDYITGGSQYVFNDAAFSQNEKYVMFGEKVRLGWVVKQYDIKNKLNSILFNGFKSARQIPEGYYILDTFDQLHFVDSLEGQPKNLNTEFSIDLNTRWFAFKDKVYWSAFDGKSTTFNTLNVSTGTKHQTSFDSTQISSKFHVKQDGKSALLQNNSVPDFDILKININQ